MSKQKWTPAPTSPLDHARVIVSGPAPVAPTVTEMDPPAPTEAADNRPPPPAPPNSDAFVRCPWYKVTSPRKQISWGRSMAAFAPGDLISEETHGPGAIERVRSCGIELVEVPPPK